MNRNGVKAHFWEVNLKGKEGYDHELLDLLWVRRIGRYVNIRLFFSATYLGWG